LACDTLFQGLPSVVWGRLYDKCSQAFMLHAEKYRDLFRNPERIILLNRASVAGLASVTVDHFQGAYLATKHLLALGHRRVAFFGEHCSIELLDEKLDLPGMYRRFRGYLHAIKECHLQPIIVDKPEEILDIKEPVTGIYCGRSWGAADLLGICIDRGIRVPEDLSIVGQDDAREKELMRPRLTCVDVKPLELGCLVGQMALDVMAGKRVISLVVSPELVIRESTCKPVA